jgi:hypothetical protein
MAHICDVLLPFPCSRGRSPSPWRHLAILLWCGHGGSLLPCTSQNWYETQFDRWIERTGPDRGALDAILRGQHLLLLREGRA